MQWEAYDNSCFTKRVLPGRKTPSSVSLFGQPASATKQSF
uniref:Uncharacterized protein n=1 Tax=Rhizophora mucronata TaxID=61149 RepID=A0A2P2MRK6_RHIMU